MLWLINREMLLNVANLLHSYYVQMDLKINGGSKLVVTEASLDIHKLDKSGLRGFNISIGK